MGKRQIGDMQPNELVVTLLLSEIAAIPLQDTAQPILNCIIAIFILVIMEIVFSILSLKSTFVRRLLNGQAVVIIKNGVIAKLEEAGVEEGDTIRMYGHSFEYYK